MIRLLWQGQIPTHWLIKTVYFSYEQQSPKPKGSFWARECLYIQCCNPPSWHGVGVGVGVITNRVKASTGPPYSSLFHMRIIFLYLSVASAFLYDYNYSRTFYLILSKLHFNHFHVTLFIYVHFKRAMVKQDNLLLR